MVKSLAPQQKGQRCQFLIGPSSTWFFPSNADIWSQPKGSSSSRENVNLSYFIYGSIGCFCYGEINHHYDSRINSISGDSRSWQSIDSINSTSATLNHLVDIKEDNFRVSCTRFLKEAMRPLAMILTDNGTLVVHDCIDNENLVHFKKAELVIKFTNEPEMRFEEATSDHCSKKVRTDTMHQFSSCLWPNAKNAFLGVSLPRKKTNLLFWLKLKDVTKMDKMENFDKNGFIESYEKLELKLHTDLHPFANPICCMESVLLDSQTCLIAIAMDDGFINVIKVNFEQGQAKRIITLARDREQVCSLSFLYDGVDKKFPLGLLASAFRSGLVAVWDIENEFCFAYHTINEDRATRKIDWLACKLIPPNSSGQINLAVSNSFNGLSILNIKCPRNPKTNLRLKEAPVKPRRKNGQQGSDEISRHHALIFNINLDSITQTLMTTSIDGNIIFWKYHQPDSSPSSAANCGNSNNDDVISLVIKPDYLYPTMSDNSRTHMIRHSPIRENFLALALGRGGIKFYKISENPKDNRFHMSSSCSEVARRISKSKLSPTSVAWHPSHEYRLAIGTLEGKVLRVDLTPRRATLVEVENKQRPNRYGGATTSSNKDTSRDAIEDILEVEYEPLERGDGDEGRMDTDSKAGSKNSHEQRQTDGVYSLTWGPNPCCPQDLTRLAIYAIGSTSHRLFIYENYSNKKDTGDDKEKLTDYLDEFLDQSLPEAIGEASEVSWKSSMDLMALGTTNGKIIIVSYLDEFHAERSRNSLFQKLAVIQGPLGTTFIQCLSWHPSADEDDPYYYYIAATSSESPAYVFNLKESMLVADVKARLRIQDTNLGERQTITNENTTSTKMATSNILSSHVYKLDGHKKPISDISWNPHKPNELATSSFDRNCFVWLLGDGASTAALAEPLQARVVAKFAGRHRLFTVEWSLVDTDLILTSGQDSTIWAWRPSGNRAKNENSQMML